MPGILYNWLPYPITPSRLITVYNYASGKYKVIKVNKNLLSMWLNFIYIHFFMSMIIAPKAEFLWWSYWVKTCKVLDNSF